MPTETDRAERVLAMRKAFERERQRLSVELARAR